MSNYYAIQDTNIGLIQWVGSAVDEVDALRIYADEIGGTEDQSEITELTAAQYERLRDCDGSDQATIDYLESIK